jgi:hypothetical protein
MYLMNSMNKDYALFMLFIHATAQFITGGAKGRVQVGFFDSHSNRDKQVLDCH